VIRQVQSSIRTLFDLPHLRIPCFFFSSRRLSFAILLAPVFLLTLPRVNAARYSSVKRAATASLLPAWLRVCCDTTRNPVLADASFQAARNKLFLFLLQAMWADQSGWMYCTLPGRSVEDMDATHVIPAQKPCGMT